MFVMGQDDGLERQATELIAALPPDERADILLPHQERLRRRREVPLSPVLAARGEDPSRLLAEWEDRDELLSRAQLSATERAVVLLYAHQGMDDAEIARLFGVQRQAIWVWRTRGIRKLRAAVQSS